MLSNRAPADIVREWLATATSVAVLTGAGISAESGIPTAQPNAGHAALAELERLLPSFTLMTQNVDGLHDRAGSRRILKIHGDIWTLRCTACAREWRDVRPSLPELPPKCECGGLARPGVVWFGEGLPENVWSAAVEAARAAELLLVIGTSAMVYPAAGLVQLAQSAGAKVVEINVAETPVSAIVDLSWRASATAALPQLIQSAS